MTSLGQDLAAIRDHLGYDIQDIQDATKIPLNTLQAIESGDIFSQSAEIKTYVRSFVRSYGRALKLDDDIIVRSLNQQEEGMYNHLVLENFPELYAKADPVTPPEKTAPAPAKKEDKPKPQAEKPKEAKAPKKAASQDAKEEEPKKEFSPAPDPGVRNINWADMGRRFTIVDQKGTPAWIIGAVIVILLILAAAYFLFENNFFASDPIPVQEPVPEQTAPQNESGQDLQLNLSDSPSDEQEPTHVLADTLYLTVYAATDKLEPVRVWSDLKPRVDPYWLDQGTAFNFEFSDTIRVRGQYSRMLLFLNGHLISGFRQNYYNAGENSVELTRSLFEDDPEWAVPVPHEIPEGIAEPDSIANRPSFPSL